jgi:general secretion pathway protein I
MRKPSYRKSSGGAPNYRRRFASSGFTLLEVLIALAIVALSAGALLGAVTSSGSNVSYLRDKTLSEWVSLNRLTEIRMAADMPAAGRRKGNSVMGGMRWEWEEEVTQLPVQGMFRVEVRSRATGEAVDDSKPTEQPKQQTVTPTTSSGTSTANAQWTSTATGVVGSSRSDMKAPLTAPMSGNTSAAPGGPPGTNPSPPPKTGAPSS